MLTIGVTARHGNAEWLYRNTCNYLNILVAHGAAPVVLAADTPTRLPNGHTFCPDSAGRFPDSILDHLDGLILSGGGDVDPKHFGAELDGAEPENIDHKRDELELTLARRALAINAPIFGICRGCQVLNVAAGGGMIQHFDGHRSPKDNTAYHDVLVLPHTRFHQIVGQEVLTVNTFHHQGMDRAGIAPIFAPAAIAHPDTWLVEAYESRDHRWIMGVQWHPERAFELSEPHQALWRSFLTACQDHTARLRHGPPANTDHEDRAL
jgi:putative glutamine amidotransferase